MLSWFTGPPKPGVNDVVAHGDQLRELTLELRQQRARVAAAAALRNRVLSDAPSTTLQQIDVGLKAMAPLVTSAADALDTAVATAVRKHGGEACLTEPVPIDVVVFITTNVLSETNAVVDAAHEAANSLEKQLTDAASAVQGPTLAAVAEHRLLRMSRDGHVIVASMAHLPLTLAHLERFCGIVTKSPFVGAIDLTGCYLPAGSEATLLEMLAGLQHLVHLSIAHNGLPVSAGRLLAAKVADRNFCPALRCIALEGNDFAESDVAEVSDLLAMRGASRIERCHGSTLGPAGGGAEGGSTRVLSLDGGAMLSILQLEYLMQLQRDVSRQGRHIAEDFDLIVASGWSAVLACALAMRRPLNAVDAFFAEAGAGFAEDHRTYYAEKAARAVRDWWSGGNFYNKQQLEVALDRLFGGSRFDFASMNVILPVSRHSSANDKQPATLRFFSAWRCASPTMQQADLIDHTAPAPLIRDVLLSVLSTPTLFAPQPLPPGPSGAHGCVVSDPIDRLPNPAQVALLEGLCMNPTAPVSIRSVSAHPAPVSAGTAPSTLHVIAGTLEAFPADRDAPYVRLVTAAKYRAEASAAAAATLTRCVPDGTASMERVLLQSESSAKLSLRIDEGDENVMRTVRQAVAQDLSALAALGAT